MYNPSLESTPTPMQTNATPSFLGVVDSLVGLGLDTIGNTGQSAPRQPTEGERFANDWITFSNNQPASRVVDMNYARDFAQQYPQYGNRPFEYAQGQGVPEKPQEEMNRDVFMEWQTTPAGTLAQMTAGSMPPEEKDAYLWEQYGIELKEKADLEKLNRDKAKFEADGTLQTKQWEVLLPQAVAVTDNVINSVVHPILLEVMNGGTITLSPEEAQAIGTRLTEINMNNLPLLLNEAKTYLRGSYSNAYMSNFGAEGVPPKEMEDRLFGTLDELIKTAQQIDSPQERASALSAIIEADSIKKLDKAGLSFVGFMAKNFGDLLVTELLSPDVRDKFVPLVMGEQGSVLSVADITTNAANQSVADSKQATVGVVELIDAGVITPEFFTAFAESQKRGGFQVVDGPTFTSVIGKNVTKLKELAASDPAFKIQVEDWLSSDLQKTVTGIQQRLPKGLSLSFQNGRFMLMEAYPGALPPNMSPGFSAGPLELAESNLPKGLNIKVLNEKMSSLGLLGDLGKPIFESITSSFGPIVPEKSGSNEALGAKLKNIQLTQGTLPEAPGWMAAAFASAEQEAGIPTGYLTTLAAIESNFNTGADNALGSGGAGIFQIMPATARAYGISDPKDFNQSMSFIKEFTVDNLNILRDSLGREPLPYELYMAHQQGAGGAPKLLTADPNALAVDVLSSKKVTMNGGTAGMTVAEFTNVWVKKWAEKSGQGPAGMPYTVAETLDSPLAPKTSPRPGRPTGEPTVASEGMSAAQVAKDAQTPSVASPTASMSEEERKAATKGMREGKLTSASIKALLRAMGEDPDSIPVFDTEEEFKKAVASGAVQKGQTVVVNGVMVDA